MVGTKKMSEILRRRDFEGLERLLQLRELIFILVYLVYVLLIGVTGSKDVCERADIFIETLLVSFPQRKCLCQ